MCEMLPLLCPFLRLAHSMYFIGCVRVHLYHLIGPLIPSLFYTNDIYHCISTTIARSFFYIANGISILKCFIRIIFLYISLVSIVIFRYRAMDFIAQNLLAVGRYIDLPFIFPKICININTSQSLSRHVPTAKGEQ